MNKKVKTIILIFIVIIILISTYILIGILKNGNVRVINTDDKEIVFKDGAIINGYQNGVNIYNGNVTIEESGKYTISGESTNSQIIVNADNVVLTLDNLNLTSKKGPVIKTDYDNLVITLKDDTTSTLTDSNAPRDEDAVVYSTKKITLNGSGILIINGKYKNAIKSLGNLQIEEGTYNATSIESGYIGKNILIEGGYLNTLECISGIIGETFTINGGYISLNVKEVGINTTLSNITISGGDIKINTEKTAMKSNDSIYINDGNIELTNESNTNPIIDYAKDYLINKGVILTTSNTETSKDPSDNSKINTIKINIGKEIKKNKVITISDDKKILLEYKLESDTKTITYSSEDIIEGKNYIIKIFNTEYETGEIKNKITSVNENNIISADKVEEDKL